MNEPTNHDEAHNLLELAYEKSDEGSAELSLELAISALEFFKNNPVHDHDCTGLSNAFSLVGFHLEKIDLAESGSIRAEHLTHFIGENNYGESLAMMDMGRQSNLDGVFEMGRIYWLAAEALQIRRVDNGQVDNEEMLIFCQEQSDLHLHEHIIEEK